MKQKFIDRILQMFKFGFWVIFAYNFTNIFEYFIIKFFSLCFRVLHTLRSLQSNNLIFLPLKRMVFLMYVDTTSFQARIRMLSLLRIASKATMACGFTPYV